MQSFYLVFGRPLGRFLVGVTISRFGGKWRDIQALINYITVHFVTNFLQQTFRTNPVYAACI